MFDVRLFLGNLQCFEPCYEELGMSDVRFDVRFPTFREVIS